MNRQPLEFTPKSALEAIARLGYHHVSRSTPRELMESFLAVHNLAIEDTGACFTVTIVHSGQKVSGTDWERIRLERTAKRERAAVAKKKKEQSK